MPTEKTMYKHTSSRFLGVSGATSQTFLRRDLRPLLAKGYPFFEGEGSNNNSLVVCSRTQQPLSHTVRDNCSTFVFAREPAGSSMAVVQVCRR